MSDTTRHPPGSSRAFPLRRRDTGYRSRAASRAPVARDRLHAGWACRSTLDGRGPWAAPACSRAARPAIPGWPKTRPTSRGREKDSWRSPGPCVRTPGPTHGTLRSGTVGAGKRKLHLFPLRLLVPLVKSSADHSDANRRKRSYFFRRARKLALHAQSDQDDCVHFLAVESRRV